MPNIGAITGPLKTAARSLGNAVPSAFSAARRAYPYVFRHKSAEPFTLLVQEVAPIGLLGLLYLYSQGKSARSGTMGPHNKWLSALAEGGVTSALVQNTKNIYPGLALGWSAYEAGTAPTRTEQVKALVKGAALFSLGYLGVHLGLWVNDGLRYRDANRLLEELKRLNPLMASTGELPRLLNNLKTTSQSFANNVFKKANADTIKKLTETFNKAKDALSTALTPARLSSLGSGVRTPLNTISKIMNSSNNYELLRKLNPWFMYILTTTFVGVPLVKLISGQFWPGNKQEAAQSMPPPVAPLWLDRITGLDTLLGEGNYSGDHGVVPADGPGLLQQARVAGGIH